MRIPLGVLGYAQDSQGMLEQLRRLDTSVGFTGRSMVSSLKPLGSQSQVRMVDGEFSLAIRTVWARSPFSSSFRIFLPQLHILT